MSDLVSIIVPIYNKENEVCRCVKSLIGQTYTNIEVILVDDGSSDHSLQKCKEFAQIDNRVIVLHKENGGISDARNYGLSKATGSWIAFVDGDDYVSNDYIQELVRYSSGVDLVICNCHVIQPNKRVEDKHVYGNHRFENKQSVFNAILKPMITLDYKNGNLLFQVWNKLYKKEIIDENQVKFDTNLSMAEDYLFNLSYCRNISSAQFIDLPLYNYDRSIPNTLSKQLITIDTLEKYYYIHSQVAQLFPEIGQEVLPMIVIRNATNHLNLYARRYGNDGYVAFCNGVYAMSSFKEACKKRGGVTAFLRRNNMHSLFVCWAYMSSTKSFLKNYISKLIKC